MSNADISLGFPVVLGTPASGDLRNCLGLIGQLAFFGASCAQNGTRVLRYGGVNADNVMHVNSGYKVRIYALSASTLAGPAAGQTATISLLFNGADQAASFGAIVLSNTTLSSFAGPASGTYVEYDASAATKTLSAQAVLTATSGTVLISMTAYGLMFPTT